LNLIFRRLIGSILYWRRKMAKKPGISGVESALDDLINLEQERLKGEENERLAREAKEKSRKEEEERKREEKAERARKEEEAARLASEKADRDERERRALENQMEEMKLKKELEMQMQLQEESLRLDHEKQLMQFAARHKKKIPGWVFGIFSGVFIIGALAAGIVLYQMKKEADRIEQDRLTAIKAAEEKDKKRKTEIQKLQNLLEGLEERVGLSEEELARAEEIKAEIEKLENLQAEADKRPGKGGKGGKGKQNIASESGDEFNLDDDPLANIEKEASGKKKKKKKKKRLTTIKTKGNKLGLDDPLQML